MKKIKMIMGGYGLTLKDGRVHLKTADDEPFDVPDKDAANLVESGYAEYVGKKTAKKATKPEVEQKKPDNEQEVAENREEIPETEENVSNEAEDADINEDDFEESDYNSMTIDELHKIADDLGVEYKVKDRKDDLIRKIEEAVPPTFEPQGVEQ